MVLKTPEHDPFLNPKCMGPDLYGKMDRVKWSGMSSPRARGPPRTGVFFPRQGRCPGSGNITLRYNTTRGAGAKKFRTLECRGPMFADVRPFRALLLNIPSAITPSISGARGSSSDGRQLSPLPFHNMPHRAYKMNTETK